MSSASSVLPSDLVSVEVAAQQVAHHPQTSLTRCTFPVRYPVAHRKGPQMANPRPTPKPGNLGPPRPPGTSGNPAGYSRGRRISDAIDRLIEEMAPVRSGSPGATPPGYELAPHTGLDKAPPRTRDEGRLDARATSHWSRIATEHRSCLPGAVTSA